MIRSLSRALSLQILMLCEPDCVLSVLLRMHTFEFYSVEAFIFLPSNFIKVISRLNGDVTLLRWVASSKRFERSLVPRRVML
jgi:hypothetical protein